MNGYSKMKTFGSKNSPDFSDPPSLPLKSPKNDSKTSPNLIPKPQIAKETLSRNGSRKNPSFDPGTDDDEGERRERFGPILSRTTSVSSGSRRYKYDNKNGKSSVQSAVRRAISMSRSSSVSERYSRIHNQDVTMPSLYDHGQENNYYHNNEGDYIMKKKKKSKSGKILKACKSLFRL